MSNKIKVEKTSSSGIVLGKAYVVKKSNISISDYKVNEVSEEISKFEDAVKESKEEILKLSKTSDIFNAHLMIVEDIILYETVIKNIKDNNKNVEIALNDAIEEISNLFSIMEDEYMKERSADVKDVGNRIMAKIKGIDINPFENINEEVIIISEDLTPSDTSLLNLDLVKGFITELGGVTSHVSIIANNLNLPVLVGVGNILSQVNTGDMIAMNASTGEIIINPSKEEINHYRNLENEFKLDLEKLKELEKLKATTKDNVSIQLCANVGNLLEIEMAIKYNIDGIGLFRTEGLYLESNHFPTEDEQFEVYKKASELCQEKEVIIRTLDIGGDKNLPYYKFDFEENPFLGFRAIRICLELKDIFKTQLKAILRASAYGNIKIMYPMIISIEELEMANKILNECKKDLDENNIKYNKNIEVGIMIETPSSVILAEEFAEMVDFFSIGTNDLTQYMLVVDRGNKKIAHMYNPFHPTVLRSIQKVIDAAHKHNIKVGMCGEFAGDIKATKLLVGMGIDELSMSAGQINKIKKEILNISFEEAKKYKEEILKNRKNKL